MQELFFHSLHTSKLTKHSHENYQLDKEQEDFADQPTQHFSQFSDGEDENDKENCEYDKENMGPQNPNIESIQNKNISDEHYFINMKDFKGLKHIENIHSLYSFGKELGSG